MPRLPRPKQPRLKFCSHRAPPHIHASVRLLGMAVRTEKWGRLAAWRNDGYQPATNSAGSLYLLLVWRPASPSKRSETRRVFSNSQSFWGKNTHPSDIKVRNTDSDLADPKLVGREDFFRHLAPPRRLLPSCSRVFRAFLQLASIQQQECKQSGV